jgi:hypothetical protein
MASNELLSGDDSMGVPYVWDYDLDQAQFLAILDGKKIIGRLDSDWAAIRLLDYGPIASYKGFRGLPDGPVKFCSGKSAMSE